MLRRSFVAGLVAAIASAPATAGAHHRPNHTRAHGKFNNEPEPTFDSYRNQW